MSQPLGISTGGLISRRAFVTETDNCGIALVGEACMMNFRSVTQFIRAAAGVPGFQRIWPVPWYRVDRCVVELHRFRPSEKAWQDPPVRGPAAQRNFRAFGHRLC